MFGYVKLQSSELLVREYELYKAIYCGVCRAMKKKTGCLSSFTLSYDFVFLSVVRMVLAGDGELKCEKHRCMAHPFRARNMIIDDEIDYSARSAAVLSYLKVKDDIADSGFLRRMALYAVLPYVSVAKSRANLPKLLDEARDDISELSENEKKKCASVDCVADIFGKLLSRIFSFGLDGEKSDIANKIGYRLGKIIYELDALDDYKRDVKNKNYNPFACLYGNDGLAKAQIQNIKCAITLELYELEKEINRIDFGGRDAAQHIIKNVLYLGLVSELERICKKYTELCDSKSDIGKAEDKQGEKD
ncbi:MAG: DUF5685 family protein [Eubacteriales bacterium]|nr:DUF5685 family protein [Eubacteriales bacterium]